MLDHQRGYAFAAFCLAGRNEYRRRHSDGLAAAKAAWKVKSDAHLAAHPEDGNCNTKGTLKDEPAADKKWVWYDVFDPGRSHLSLSYLDGMCREPLRCGMFE